MKHIAIAALALFTMGTLQAKTVELTKEIIEFGALSQDENGPANEVIELVRTPNSPKKIILKYKMNSLEKGCTNYTILYTKVDPIVQVQCQPRLDETYACEKVTHDGYGIPERVCADEGYLLVTKSYELVLNFKKAIELTEGSEERFQIGIKQKKMTRDSLKFSGKVLSSMSKYKVSTWGDSVIFKAK